VPPAVQLIPRRARLSKTEVYCRLLLIFGRDVFSGIAFGAVNGGVESLKPQSISNIKTRDSNLMI
jgi:hypothetical protein